MKFIYTLLAVIAAITFSCDPNSDDKVDPNGEYSFYITGINESLTYTFSPSNGRIAQTVPEDVKSLTILILDAEGSLVYNQHYYNHNTYYDYEDSLDATGNDYYYYENTIPDTLFIPGLPAGEYTVLATTADFYYDYYYNGFGPEGDHRSYPKLHSYISSEGPIYVGKQDIQLTEDEIELQMPMENISTKITMKKINGGDENMWIDLSISTVDAHDYSFENEELVPSEYGESSIYAWIDYGAEKSTYALPATIASISLNYYDYQTGVQMSHKVDIDPNLEMNIGDAITFTVDVEALASGAGTGVFDWEDIDWNDLGEINVP
ncbi:MAG: hypothetical protein ABJN36_10145 [Cyclobacteriaceae bacterium]